MALSLCAMVSVVRPRDTTSSAACTCVSACRSSDDVASSSSSTTGFCNTARDGDSLLLPAGELRASLSHLRVVPAGIALMNPCALAADAARITASSGGFARSRSRSRRRSSSSSRCATEEDGDTPGDETPGKIASSSSAAYASSPVTYGVFAVPKRLLRARAAVAVSAAREERAATSRLLSSPCSALGGARLGAVRLVRAPRVRDVVQHRARKQHGFLADHPDDRVQPPR